MPLADVVRGIYKEGTMKFHVRLMELAEVELVIDYFHGATPEFLETMGVDPTRLPSRAFWRDRAAADWAKPVQKRSSVFVIWLADNEPAGFSSADTIRAGEDAKMHLHILNPDRRGQGIGVEGVKRSVATYFDELQLKRVIAEPNAFNVAPNRTLQKAGFKYLKTHRTVPGPLNYHQTVNRWVFER